MNNFELTIPKSVQHSENPVVEKSFSFATQIVKSNKYLIKKDKSLISLYNQLLRSGASIGANIAESQVASSKSDFRNKLRISLKEAYETEYWLKLFFDSEMLEKKEFESPLKDCLELIKLLTSIIKCVTLKT